MKRTTIFWWILGGIIVVGLLASSRLLQSGTSGVVARTGLHWHPELVIYVDGVKQELPANIGLGAVHEPMHTHDEDASQGIVHLEFNRTVREGDLRLRHFFRSWGKDIMSSFGTLERMTVNGKDNTEYGEYELRERDVVELYYQSGSVSQ